MPPRNYSVIVMLTALQAQRQCSVCKYASFMKISGVDAHSYYGLFYVVSNCERACSQHLGQVVGKDRIQRMEG